MSYVAGWNMPGYLCDTEPVEFSTFYEAKHYIIEEIFRYIHELYDMGRLDDEGAEAAEINAAKLKGERGAFNFMLKDYIFWVHND